MRMSGHADLVTATKAAAARTAVLPITSLREQTHADRMLISSSRRRRRSIRQTRFAVDASTPIAPMTSTVGVNP